MARGRRADGEEQICLQLCRSEGFAIVKGVDLEVIDTYGQGRAGLGVGEACRFLGQRLGGAALWLKGDEN